MQSPGKKSDSDVCIMEKSTFARKLMKCPLFPGNIRMSLKAGEGGVQTHVQTAGRREPMQSSGKKSDSGRVQQGKRRLLPGNL